MNLSGTAYSYIRFSTEKQSEGDSRRRQNTAVQEFIKEHNLILDQSTYEDLGVSAFKGKNVEEGSLGLFLKAVEEGAIKKGSILLVESLDRISREHPMVAQALFLRIINRGITIVTLIDKQIYSEERMRKENGMPLMFSLVHMMRAHEESATKSSRVRAGLAEKRRKVVLGEDRMHTAPAWLKRSEGNVGWEIIPEKAKVVRRIFDLADQDNGAHKIMKFLEDEQFPPLLRAKHWSQGNVSSVMSNAAAMGTLVIKADNYKTIDNYYPPVVSKEQWLRVQQAQRVRQTTGGTKSEKVSNLFSGISYCLYCGGRTRFVVSARGSYVHCLASYSRNISCNAKPMPYKAAETAILDRMMNIQLRTLSAGNAEDDKKAILQNEVEQLKATQKQAIELMLKMPDVTPLQEKLQSLQQQISTVEAEIKAHSSKSIPMKEAKYAAELFERHKLLSESDSPELVELRKTMQIAIRRQLRKVEFGANFAESDLLRREGRDFFVMKANDERVSLNTHCLVQLTYTSGKKRIVDADEFMPSRTMVARANRKAKE